MFRIKFEKELSVLKLSLLKLCSSVSEQIKKSVESLINFDKTLAKKVAGDDDLIDDMEKDIESQCHKILLRENPVARDFREVFAILKMITDLERIGDQAEDIANLVLSLNNQKSLKKFAYIPQMADIALEMVNNSVNAYIKDDVLLAEKTIKKDDVLDDMFTSVKQDLVKKIKLNSEYADEIISVIMIAKYLERIGDHAVNICEWIKYFEQGHK